MLEVTISDTEKTPELAKYAQVEKDCRKPYLETDATVYDVNNKPIMFSKTYYDPEHFTFGMVRKRRYDFDDFWSEKWIPSTR